MCKITRLSNLKLFHFQDYLFHLTVVDEQCLQTLGCSMGKRINKLRLFLLEDRNDLLSVSKCLEGMQFDKLKVWVDLLTDDLAWVSKSGVCWQHARNSFVGRAPTALSSLGAILPFSHSYHLLAFFYIFRSYLLTAVVVHKVDHSIITLGGNYATDKSELVEFMNIGHSEF